MQNIIIVMNPVNYSHPRRIEAQRIAIDVLSKLPSNIYVMATGYVGSLSPIKLPLNIEYRACLERNSAKEIGNDRELPYIKEMLNFASYFSPNIIGYINSDILLGEDFLREIKKKVNAYVFSRSDIGEVNVNSFLDKKFKVIYGGDKHEGADGFFFNTDWWLKNSTMFPEDLIIGETEWDTCFRHIVRKKCKNHIEKRCLFHVHHQQAWTTTSPGAINNIKIWEEVKKI